MEELNNIAAKALESDGNTEAPPIDYTKIGEVLSKALRIATAQQGLTVAIRSLEGMGILGAIRMGQFSEVREKAFFQKEMLFAQRFGMSATGDAALETLNRVLFRLTKQTDEEMTELRKQLRSA